MANEIYDSSWWGNTIDTASSIGTSTEMIQGQFNLTKIGAEKVVNGDFSDGLNGWTSHAGSTLELENGMAKVTTIAGQGFIKRTDLSIETGKTYFCKAYITNGLAPYWFVNSVSDAVNLSLISENTYGGYVTTTGNNPFFYIRGNNTNGEITYIDNVSVKEVRASSVEAVKCLADAIHRIGIQNIQN